MRRLAFLVLALALAAPALAQAPRPEPLPDSVGVGVWSPGARGETHHIKVDGEAIYLDGVLQEERYHPGCVIEITDGKALCARPAEVAQPKDSGEATALERLERRIGRKPQR